jgi:hypothetical protein
VRRAAALAALAILAGATGAAAQEWHDSATVVRICAGGDVTLGVNGDTTIKNGKRIPPRVWPAPMALIAPLVPLFADADIVLLNAEGAIGDGVATKCVKGSKNCFAMRMPASAAPALRAVNERAVVVANVANNHAHDAGDDGFAETLRLLDSAGVRATGADSEPTIVVTRQGDSVAILGFAASPPMDVRDLELVRRLVARAAAITPRVVVTMHLGAEGPKAQRTRDQNEKFVGEERGDPVAVARAAVESGALLVIGHGPHVVRGMQRMGTGSVVFYSLGNLVNAGPFSMNAPNDRGVVVCADVSTKAVLGATLRPTRQREQGIVSPDLSGRTLALMDSLSHLDFRDSTLKLRVEAVWVP